eukprot:gnl/Spiro4/429_TR236_c0_g1_i1.p1 gnl/Spiro4/429_TR236_c0_g1~~gnl/Spiro4/429_TR236_c0_g1_i1.p1  ORF type:complete len:557 (-),score=66.89 gnl/Spiro4/429_TR236_c0_g1_i1:47-1717(-)
MRYDVIFFCFWLNVSVAVLLISSSAASVSSRNSPFIDEDESTVLRRTTTSARFSRRSEEGAASTTKAITIIDLNTIPMMPAASRAELRPSDNANHHDDGGANVANSTDMNEEGDDDEDTAISQTNRRMLRARRKKRQEELRQRDAARVDVVPVSVAERPSTTMFGSWGLQLYDRTGYLSDNGNAVGRPQAYHDWQEDHHALNIIAPHPLALGVELYIADIFDINVVRQTFAIQMLTRYHWVDPRLGFDEGHMGTDALLLPFDETLRKKIWLPNLFVRNQIGVSHPYADIRDSTIKITQDGKVLWTEVSHLDLAGHFDFTLFPYDFHILEVIIAQYDWEKTNIYAVRKPISIANFPCEEWNFLGAWWDKPRGISVSLKLSILAQRMPRPYIFLNVIPTLAITMLAYITFWLDPTLTIRSNIAVFAFLTLVLQLFVIIGGMPDSDDLTVMHYFLAIAFVIVYAALVSAFLERTCLCVKVWRNDPQTRRLIKDIQAAADKICRVVLGIIMILLPFYFQLVSMYSESRFHEFTKKSSFSPHVTRAMHSDWHVGITVSHPL